MAENTRMQELAHRYKNGSATIEERAEFEQWLNDTRDQPIDVPEKYASSEQEVAERLFSRIEAQLERPVRVRSLWPRYAAAAAVVVAMVSAGAYYLTRADKPQLTAENNEQLLPQQQGVTLTLGNGKHISLQYGHHGAVQANAIQRDSVLAYQAQPGSNETNTVTNNSGRRFGLQLADGTEVTLDVNSALTYPLAFNGNSREVSATGQAYFKVKHNAAQPFRVKAGDLVIEDIGTAFNVNAYAEPNTTLVEGSIKVNEKVLKPGETGTEHNGRIETSKANLEEVTAWLQDKIFYRDAPLETILNEVSRIYHVKIVWQDDLRKRSFGVTLNRTRPLASVLDYFRETSNIDFKVEDHTVTVFKKKKKN